MVETRGGGKRKEIPRKEAESKTKKKKMVKMKETPEEFSTAGPMNYLLEAAAAVVSEGNKGASEMETEVLPSVEEEEEANVGLADVQEEEEANVQEDGDTDDEEDGDADGKEDAKEDEEDGEDDEKDGDDEKEGSDEDEEAHESGEDEEARESGDGEEACESGDGKEASASDVSGDKDLGEKDKNTEEETGTPESTPEIEEERETEEELEATEATRMFFYVSEYKKQIKLGTRCMMADVIETFLSLTPEASNSERRWFQEHPQFCHLFHNELDAKAQEEFNRKKKKNSSNHKVQGM